MLAVAVFLLGEGLPADIHNKRWNVPDRSGGHGKVIADGSILIHLSAIGSFGLLPRLFGEISVPAGVYSEVVSEGLGMPGAAGGGRDRAGRPIRHDEG